MNIICSYLFLAFPGILNWQKRLWLTLQDFQAAREDSSAEVVDTGSDSFLADDAKLFDARNFYVKGATFNYRHAHQLSVAISKMQGLTNSLRVSLHNQSYIDLYYHTLLFHSALPSTSRDMANSLNVPWQRKSSCWLPWRHTLPPNCGPSSFRLQAD